MSLRSEISVLNFGKFMWVLQIAVLESVEGLVKMYPEFISIKQYNYNENERVLYFSM
jgi:hypothetical protein